MIYSEFRFTLDIRAFSSQVSLGVKRGETGRRLRIHLTDNGCPYHIPGNCYAIFTAQKPDGNKIFNDCVIEDCAVVYDLTEQTVAATGLLSCAINLYGVEGELLISAGFNIIVYEPTVGEGDIESVSEYKALAALIKQLEDLKVIPEFTIGTVETLDPLAEATASIGGTAAKPVLNLGIPRGSADASGEVLVLNERVNELVKVPGSGGKGIYEFTPNGLGDDATGSITVQGNLAILRLEANCTVEPEAWIEVTDIPEAYKPYSTDGVLQFPNTDYSLEYQIDDSLRLYIVNTSDSDVREFEGITLFYQLSIPYSAELNDIRVGHDGTVYETAGDAVREQVKAAIEGGTGLTGDQVNALDAMFRAMDFPSKEAAEAYKAFCQAFGITGSGDDSGESDGDSGTGEDTGTDSGTVYSVTNNLTGVVNSNKAATSSGYYSATLSAEDGYDITVTITMGGADITNSVYTEDGTILIPDVTGNIVITATAELKELSVRYQLANAPVAANADLYEDTGLTFGSSSANGYTKAWTLCVDFEVTGNKTHAYGVNAATAKCLDASTNEAGTLLAYVCSAQPANAIPAISGDNRFRYVITHAANSGRVVELYCAENGVVAHQTVTATYGAFDNAVYAGSLFVGGRTAAEFVGTIHEFTIYTGVLPDAHIAEFLEV